MKTPDRTKQPAIKTVDKAILLKPQETKLDNSAPLYSFNAGTQDVIKIECVFDAGSWHQPKTLVAFSTAKMLTEGTKNHTAAELAEIFDSYGAYVEAEPEKDYSFVSLYSLNKHLEKLLPVFAEMLRESIFPQKELNVLLSNSKQDQLVSMQRVNYVAKAKFAEQLFGKAHPYGQHAAIEDYDKIVPDDLKDFYKKFYHAGNLRIVASGRIDDKSIKLINKYLGDKSWKATKKAVAKPHDKVNSSNKKNFVPKEGAMQSAVRIGKVLFTKNHPDYLGMAVLNTILGDYFGSRLMTNIREDKGYTYGIGSAVVSFRNAGYLFIASEVGADIREKAVEEIYKEIKKLKKEKVKKDELELVRNYMTGTFLRSIDGPFAIADRFISTLDYGFDFNDYYNNYIKTIKEITPEQLLNLASKYFNEDSFYETVVGK